MSSEEAIYHDGNYCNQHNDTYSSFVCFVFGQYGLNAGHLLAGNRWGVESKQNISPSMSCPKNLIESLALPLLSPVSISCQGIKELFHFSFPLVGLSNEPT